ncbi:MAG: hypothetical protein CR988_01045 [Treponema sp.]|nr:MAG: hypothetical protein CR988_01045 [Treponema sp.]
MKINGSRYKELREIKPEPYFRTVRIEFFKSDAVDAPYIFIGAGYPQLRLSAPTKKAAIVAAFLFASAVLKNCLALLLSLTLKDL